ncbi:MAG TPA: polysaccharide pyruvyl transferase family protein [Burkholderiales bacterium]|nr:polysaccharide pyruvyl transferase family protein [Burkholderiales bacterium]
MFVEAKEAFSRDRALRIALYAPIAEHAAYSAIKKRPVARLKSVIKNAWNRLSTRITGTLVLSDYHYLTRQHTNKGDLAIRVAIREQLIEAFNPQQLEFLEITWGDMTPELLREVNASCDLFVIGGGGYVFVRGDGSTNTRLEDINFLRQISCPVIAYAIGMNRLMHEQLCGLDEVTAETKKKLGELARLCAHMSVRDVETRQLFAMHVDKLQAPAVVGDPVLFLRKRNESRGRGVVAERCRIGINLAAHGWQAIQVLTGALSELVAFLRWLKDEYGAELVYFVHHDLEHPVADYLQAQGLQLVKIDTDPVSMIGEYAEVDFVICQMLHSSIFAANAEVPFLSIAYDQKNLAFCRLLEVPQCCIPHEHATVATLQEAFRTLFGVRDELRGVLQRRKQELQADMLEFQRRIKELRAHVGD